MPEFAIILIRTLFSFIALLVMTRLMGKTQLSQLTFFDYVVGITIGSIAASLSVDQNLKILNGIIGILVWGLLPIFIAYVNLKSYRFRRLTDGRPTVLVENGKIMEQSMKKVRVTSDELMLMLRQKNAFKLADVEFAVLETNGQLSVLKKSDQQPVTPKQLDIKVTKEHAPLIVVMDGTLMEKTLQTSGYSKEWLLKEIKKQGANGLADVFVAQLTSTGSLYVDLRQDKMKQSKTKTPPS